jgi:DNA-binding response OmpR family regulator
LVVDDDHDLCDLIADFLGEEGYAVTRAYLGQSAIEAARMSAPDLVLLDLVLPDVPGLDVAHALRAAARTHDVPIVIISGDRAALARSKDEMDAESYIEKPFSLAAVQHAVRAALGQHNGAPDAAA